MRTFFMMAMAGVLSFTVACDDDDSVTPDPDPDPEEFVWEATLVGTEAYAGVQGQGAAAWTEETSEFAATVDIEGDEPEAVRPWHVHENTCEAGGGIVGPAAEYTPLAVGAEGTASAADTISVALDPEADYHINVHLSAEDLETIIACGNLELVAPTG